MKRSPIRRRNPARAAERLARDFGDQSRRCRDSLCCVCVALGTEQIGDTIPHHHRSRGAGGTDVDTLPICNYHHQLVHQQGAVSFWRSVHVDPDTVLDVMRQPGAVYDQWQKVPF